jgi:WD40 repeat protein/serine/threonine protein kinase
LPPHAAAINLTLIYCLNPLSLRLPVCLSLSLSLSVSLFADNFKLQSSTVHILDPSKPLAQGNFGQVHLADLDGAPVIVKTLKCSEKQDAVRVVQSAVREAYVAAEASSFPYIVRFYGVSMPSIEQLRHTRLLCFDDIQFVYDRATDGSLESCLLTRNWWPVTNVETEHEWKQRKCVDPFALPGPQSKHEQQVNLLNILRFVDATSIALIRTNAIGIIHADLSLRNVLVQRDINEACGCKPLLTDFGLSKMASTHSATFARHLSQSQSDETPTDDELPLLQLDHDEEASAATRNCLLACYDRLDPVAPESAPECHALGIYSDKSDAYMFGVLILKTFLRSQSFANCTSRSITADSYDLLDATSSSPLLATLESDIILVRNYTCCPDDIVQLIIDLIKPLPLERCSVQEAHERLQAAINRERSVMSQVDPNAAIRALLQTQLNDTTHAFLPYHVEMQMRMYVPLRCTFGRAGDNTPDPFDMSQFVNRLLLSNADSKSSSDNWTMNQLLSDVKQLYKVSLSQERARVVLLEGIAGSGKTLTAWHVWRQALRAVAEHANDTGFCLTHCVIPVYISLVEYRHAAKNGTLLEEFISRKFGSAFPQSVSDVVNCLQQHARLLIILDGLDELNDKILNVLECNHLHEWQSSMVIICCRSGFLANRTDITNRVAHVNTVLHLELQPFDDDQRRSLMKQYVINRGLSDGSTATDVDVSNQLAEFEQHLSSLPSLVESTKNPLNMFMMLEALPKLTAMDGAAACRLDTHSLRLSHSPVNRFGKLRRCELYAAYLDQWQEREISKLVSIGRIQDSKEARRTAGNSAMKFCQELAFEMFLHGLTRVEEHQENADDDFDDMDWSDGELHDDELADNEHATHNSVAVPNSILLLLKGANSENDLHVSPVIHAGNVYAFLHKSIQEYLAALYIANDVSKRCQHRNWSKLLQSEKRIGSMLKLSRCAVLRDPAVMLFAAELVHKRDVTMVRYQPMDQKIGQPLWPVCKWTECKQVGVENIQPFTKALFDVIEASKHHVDTKTGECPEQVRIAAGNAITILNYARVCFSGMKWSGINVSNGTSTTGRVCDAFADLSNSVMNSADLSNSNFAGAHMVDCVLDYANCHGADLRGVEFGQLPMMLGHSKPIRSIVVDPVTRTLFSGSNDNTARIWDMDTGECLSVLQGHSQNVTCLLLPGRDHSHTGSQTLYSGSNDMTVRLWDVDTGDCVKVLEGSYPITSLAIDSSDQRYLYSGGGASIHVWDVDAGECIKVLTDHRYSVTNLAFDSTTRTLYSSSLDHTIRVWEIATGKCIKVLQHHSCPVTRLVFDRDPSTGSRTLYSGDKNGIIHRWNIDTGECIGTLRAHSGRITSIVLDSASHIVHSSSKGSEMITWNIETCESAKIIQGHSGATLQCLALDSTTQTLYSGSTSNTIRAWKVDTRERRKVLEGHSRNITSVVLNFNAVPPMLYSSSQDKTILEWDMDTGECTKLLQGHSSDVSCLAIDDASHTLYSGSYDSTIRVWNVLTGKCVNIFQGHADDITCLVLDCATHTLYSGSGDSTIRIWSVQTGECTRILQGHSYYIEDLAFDRNTTTLYSRAADMSTHVWNVDTGECLKVMEDQTEPDWEHTLQLDYADGQAASLRGSTSCQREVTLPNGQFIRAEGKAVCLYTDADAPSVPTCMWYGAANITLSATDCDIRGALMPTGTRKLLSQYGARDTV